MDYGVHTKSIIEDCNETQISYSKSQDATIISTDFESRLSIIKDNSSLL